MNNLPNLDKRTTQQKVEAMFEDYRLYKYLDYEEREAAITTNLEPRYHGPTNVNSDSTADIAIYNVDQKNIRKKFCEKIEEAVGRLPEKERFLIQVRYMSVDSEYLRDYEVYERFDPPISDKTYTRIRWGAIKKLALKLNIGVPMANEEEIG